MFSEELRSHDTEVVAIVALRVLVLHVWSHVLGSYAPTIAEPA